MMRKSGTVVYLRASPELLWSRLKGSKKGSQARPLLSAPEPKSVIEQLLHERDPLYTAEADFIVDVRAESPDRMANRIRALLQKDETVEINLGERSYQVRIGRGLLSIADEIVPWVAGRQACVVTDDVVAPLYLEQLRHALPGKQVVTKILPHGEPGKNLQAAESIFELLLSTPCDREVTLIALGGGVVGDIAGFAAACYQRGVPFIQVPTTLLSQVDSSVGGKTGVNHPLGKNMIGAFHQPAVCWPTPPPSTPRCAAIFRRDGGGNQVWRDQ